MKKEDSGVKGVAYDGQFCCRPSCSVLGPELTVSGPGVV